MIWWSGAIRRAVDRAGSLKTCPDAIQREGRCWPTSWIIVASTVRAVVAQSDIDLVRTRDAGVETDWRSVWRIVIELGWRGLFPRR